MKEFLKSIIREAGDMAKPYFFRGVDVKTKADQKDFVTEADILLSDFLIQKIHEKYPAHHIKSEESEDDVNPEHFEFEWVIDPIDGTRNFAIGIPIWAVMIAIVKNGETHMAAVYHPLAGELFFAEKGKGAFLNDKKITVNSTEIMERSYGMLFRSSRFGAYGDYFEKYTKAVANFALETNVSMANFGCAGMLSYVAKGSVDFAFGNAGLDWDLLPNFLICEEAGAIVTDSTGNTWKRGRQDYIVANKILHPRILQKMNEF